MEVKVNKLLIACTSIECKTRLTGIITDLTETIAKRSDDIRTGNRCRLGNLEQIGITRP